MTNEEKRYIANQIIEELNKPASRMLARAEGKGATVHDITLYCLDGEDLLPGVRIDIEQLVKIAANRCQYPTERIPAITCKLTFEEILLLGDVTKDGLKRTGETLYNMLTVMEDNEDERGDVIAAAGRVIYEILEEGGRDGQGKV